MASEPRRERSSWTAQRTSPSWLWCRGRWQGAGPEKGEGPEGAMPARGRQVEVRTAEQCQGSLGHPASMSLEPAPASLMEDFGVHSLHPKQPPALKAFELIGTSMGATRAAAQQAQSITNLNLRDSAQVPLASLRPRRPLHGAGPGLPWPPALLRRSVRGPAGGRCRAGVGPAGGC